jgi:hypothetical protein
MNVLRSRDYRRMPWKNGGGETVEVALHPADATLALFDWRISMAHVASDGPFSLFPGIDRTLLVLDGAGVRLAIGATAAIELRPGTPSALFPGDVSTTATLIDGPITDLNVMTRRATYRHAVRYLALSESTGRVAPSHIEVLVVVAGRLRIVGGTTVELEARDAVVFEPGERAVLEPQGTVLACGIELIPR